MTNAQIKWSARVDHVVEVSLLGYADLDYWTTKLAAENLLPIARNNNAQILIVTGDARFRGVRFKEISFSVLARRADDPTDGALLLEAWNSSRFFAWCERTFFKTPYAFAQVDISAANPASVHLSDRGQTLFRAQLQSTRESPRNPTSRSPGGWSGPIFLPSAGPNHAPRYYFARLQGLTEIYPFSPDADSFTLNPTPQRKSLQSLLESHFRPVHWELRRDATHTRSRTYAAGKQRLFRGNAYKVANFVKRGVPCIRPGQTPLNSPGSAAPHRPSANGSTEERWSPSHSPR